MPESGKIQGDTNCHFAGWGHYNKSINQHSMFLKEMEMSVKKPNWLAQKIFSTNLIWGKDKTETKAKVYFGDSGGPLLCPINQINYLVGTLTSANIFGYAEFVYLKKYLPWIKEKMGNAEKYVKSEENSSEEEFSDLTKLRLANSCRAREVKIFNLLMTFSLINY